jgi:hypothetical protein
MPKPKSRPQRWSDAATDAAQALSDMEQAKDKFEEAMVELKSVQDEYEEWKDNLPENLQQSPLGEKLEEVCGLDIESASSGIDSAIDGARGVVDEAQGLDLPRGFGKD